MMDDFRADCNSLVDASWCRFLIRLVRLVCQSTTIAQRFFGLSCGKKCSFDHYAIRITLKTRHF